MTALPTLFGDDVVDNVDSVMAEHVNNLRAWHLAASGLALNSLSSALTTDVTLSDTDAPVQFYDCGGEARNIFLPAESTDNHPFYIGNTSTDTSAVTVMDDSGVTTIAAVDQGFAGLFVSDGIAWRAVSGGGAASQIVETGGPTTLDIGAIADGQYLMRSGTSIIGDAGSNGELKNLLINGGFDFAQRQVPATLTARADDAYCADRWYILTDGGATDIQYARVTGDTNSLYAGQLKQTNASAKYMGMAQIVEGINSVPLRGKNVILQLRAKASTNINLRCAILEWTGTIDTVTSDVVLNWESGTYTPGNFFLASNLTVTAISGALGVTTNYQTFSVTGTISASCNNLIVFFFTAGAQNVTIDVTQAGLYIADVVQEWTPRPIQQEFSLCQRYYEKSIGVDVAPVNGIAYTSTLLMYFVATSTTETNMTFKFTVPKFAVPTLAFFRTDVNATGDNLFDMLYGAAWHDNTTTGGAGVTKNQIGFTTPANDTAAVLTPGLSYAVAGIWTAEAEL